MIYNKITVGFVSQQYDSETGKCIFQEFIAGDEIEYEDENGNPVEDFPENEEYFPFEMEQPEGGE